MHIRSAAAGRHREIACDESGYEGEKLVGGETDVFAHAGVWLSTQSAASCITELRRRIRSPALEYKANHLLREKHRPVLVWLLGPRGPMHGNANVHLTDKTFLLVRTIVDLLVGTTPTCDDATARVLYRAGRHGIRPDHWTAFLASSNDLMRADDRHGAHGDVSAFYRTVDVLGRGPSDEAGRVLDLLRLSRPRVDSLLARSRGDRETVPALDLLVPAIVRTVVHWSDGGTVPVSVVHDRQTALTEARVAQITELAGGSGGRLTGLRLVDSRTDPRIQVADFLAGVARKVASYELAGRGDAELVGLLRPYVDPSSVWGDDRSWSTLRPTGQAC